MKTTPQGFIRIWTHGDWRITKPLYEDYPAEILAVAGTAALQGTLQAHVEISLGREPRWDDENLPPATVFKFRAAQPGSDVPVHGGLRIADRDVEAIPQNQRIDRIAEELGKAIGKVLQEAGHE